MERLDSFGLDNPNFQSIFRAGGGGTAAVAATEDDASIFSDIGLTENHSLSSPVASKSRRQREQPKKKKSKSKSNLADIDLTRPHSDKIIFEKLQNAKANFRRLKLQFPSSGKHFSPTTNTMAKTRRHPQQAEDDSPAPRENDDPNGKDNSATTNKGKRKATTEIEIEDEEVRDKVMEVWSKDKKLSTDKRGQRIWELLVEKFTDRKRYRESIVSWKTKHATLVKEIANLKKSMEESGQTSQEAAITLKINQEILKSCIAIAKTKLWRKQKFISDAQEEVKSAAFVLSKVDVLKLQMEKHDVKSSLIKTYKTEIKKALFGQKNYVASEIKKLVMKMLKDGETLPLASDIEKCATRKIAEEDEKLFAWYWDKLLPKMVGAKEWDTSVRYYTTISSARDPEDKKVRLITESDEAMLVLLWDNAYDRWLEEWEWRKVPANAAKAVPKWPGKYSVSNKGQTKWGGWKPEGYGAYNRYFEAAKAARKTDNCKQVEKKCLEQLRTNNKITQDNAELQDYETRRLKRAAAKGTTLDVGLPIPDPKQNIKPLTCFYSSDEDEETQAQVDAEDEV